MSARDPKQPPPSTRGRFASDFLLPALALLGGAAFNGFPILIPDSTAYLESAATRVPPVAWPMTYPLFIGALRSLGLGAWSVAAVQTALLSALLALLLRRTLPGASPRHAGALVLLLSVGTGLPWITGQVGTDVLTGCLALASFLLILHGPWPAPMTLALAAVIAFSLCAHHSHPPILAATLAVLAINRALWRRLLLPAILVVASVPATKALDRAFGHPAALSQGSQPLLMCRLIDAKLLQRLLEEHCAERNYALCAYRDAVRPLDCPGYLHGKDSPMKRIGGWPHSGTVTWPMIIDVARFYPVENGLSMARNLLKQTITFSHVFWTPNPYPNEMLYGVMNAHYPADSAKLRASRQFTDTINRELRGFLNFQWLIAGLGLAGTVLLGLVCRGKKAGPGEGFLGFSVLFCLSNALVCSAASEVHFRYGWRVTWLLVLGVALAAPERLRPSAASAAVPGPPPDWRWREGLLGAAAAVACGMLALRLVSNSFRTTPESKFAYVPKPVLVWPRTEKFRKGIPLATLGASAAAVKPGTLLQFNTESGREAVGTVVAVGGAEATVEYSWEQAKW